MKSGGPIVQNNLSWLCLYQNIYFVNTLGCSVLIISPNIFLIKACYQALGKVNKFVLRCKTFYRIDPWIGYQVPIARPELYYKIKSSKPSMECCPMVSVAGFGPGNPGSNPSWFPVSDSNRKNWVSRIIQVCGTLASTVTPCGWWEIATKEKKTLKPLVFKITK